MDSGILDVAWCQGYNGSKLSFIETGVIAYQCGRNVKFLSLIDKHGGFSFKDAAIGPVAFHKINKHIAIAECTQKPKIFIYVYPSFSELAVLKEGADLEFQTIAFSESDYLASISGVPNFKLILWNYADNRKLATVDITKEPVKSLSFNKTNWRQICMMTDSCITLWNVEQCNTKFLILSHTIRLPPANLNGHMDEYVQSFDKQTEEKPTKKNNKYIMDIPESAIAGLSGEEVEHLDVIKDSSLRVRPVSMTWLPTGDFYVGCEDGELFKVDTDLMKIHILHFPSPSVEENSKDQSNKDENSQEGDVILDDPEVAHLNPGSLQCMDFHQNGLYIAGKDGIIRLLDVTGEKIIVKEETDVYFPVTSFAFSPNYQILAWGSPNGIIQYYTCGNASSITTLLDVHHGQFVGIGGLPLGSDCAVSLREDGLLQVWKIADGTFVSELNIGEVSEGLVCSRLAQYAVVGTRSGSLCFIDLTNTQKPRLIVKQRLFRQPLKHLLFNGDAGTLLFVASDVSSVFVVDARATSGFNVLGYLTVSGKTQSLATYVGNHSTILFVACNNNPQILGSNLLHKFTFSDDMIKDIHLHYKSSMCDIKEESCRSLKMGLRHAICSLAISDPDFIFAISANTKRLITFPLPDQDKKLRKVDLLLTATGDHPGIQLPGGHVLLSPHCKWLLTYGPDGYIKIRTCTQLDKTAAFIPFEYRDGGVRSASFSDDHVYILCIGYDGIISCCQWNRFKGKSGAGIGPKNKRDRDMEFANRENARLAAFQEYVQSYGSKRKASEIEHERKVGVELDKQAAQDRDEIYISPPPTPSVNATWLEQHEIDLLRHEGQHFASVKYELRSQIRDIRKTIQNMMIQNNDLPDIEKLSRNEFDLDLEEQNRLQAEGEAEIQKVREDIEYANLSKLYIREKIKEQCWDKMNVKGRAIQAFNSALEVTNFPLRERSSDFLRLIKTVTTRRKIEMREAEARKQLAEVMPKLSTHEEEVETEDTDESSVDHLSLDGSLGALCGGANEQFYNQFDMHCREQKIYQIILIEDSIHRIKEAFNKEFDDVYGKKEQEITKVKEKNKRISKIIEYLGLDETIFEPAMSVAEKPELLFDVNESEIKAEKYLTPEQRKQLEEAKRLEEERLAREKGDNARERALEMMMGGVLEIKKEDELRKDVPKPAFMLTKKEEEFSEEEQKLFKEYLKKVQDLNEEREKFKKQLESELRKLQVTIQENLEAFDDTLNLLFERKIKIMMVVFQEELKILRLRYAMLIQEEIETQEKDLTHALEHKKHLKHQSAEAVAEAKKALEIFRNEYDTLQAEDKYLDRSFKREFSDISAVLVDVLYKHFKKRPRTNKYRNQSDSMLTKTLNPFVDRPSSALQLAVQKTQINMGLDDLDKMSNAPEGMDPLVWERMCKLRRAKVESETMLKAKANGLADVQSFLHKRHVEDDKIKAEIEQINHKLSKLKENEQRFILNLEVQLLLKQGQIEVDCGPFIQDFRDSVLIHRSVVEDLNTTIKQLGESKIASMVESKDFRKGIIQLEWEHKKMSMEMEDLESKMKDIQFIKVTREIQAFLQEEDYEAKKQAEIATLEQTITMLKKHHERNVAKKKQTLKSIQKGVKNKEASNEKLYAELLDLNVVVNERRHIEEVNGGCRDDGGEARRYNEIKQRRKLVDLAKAQAQEIAILRAEVERLRMRTFPALVQVER